MTKMIMNETREGIRETVLITGGCGFIGSNTVRKMLNDGYRVVVVDEMNDYYDPHLKRDNLRHLRDLASSLQLQLPPLEAPLLTFFETDIANMQEMTQIFELEKPSLVIHLAARAGVRYSIEDPAVYAHSNVLGTTTILELSQRFKVRSVAMASSSSVYGDRPDSSQGAWIEERGAPQGEASTSSDEDHSEDELPGAFRETDSVNMPASPYAATKRACELLAYTYTQLYNLPIACLRFFTVYGPGGRPDMAPYKFIHRIMHGIPIDRYGDGSAIRDFTYVDDIVDGIVLSLLKPQGYQIYNLGGGRPISLAKFITLCEEAVGKKAIINVMPTQPGDVARTHASITKARKMLGFRAKVEVATGLKRMADWYKAFVAEKTRVAAVVTRKSMGPTGEYVMEGSSTADRDSDSGISSDMTVVDETATDDMAAEEEVVPRKLVVCGRIHNMTSLSAERKVLVEKLVNSTLSLPIPASVCIAVEYASGKGGDTLFRQVEEAAYEAAESDLSSSEARRLVHVLPIMNWGITTALNACIHHADSLGACYTAFCSMEVTFDSQVMSVLVSECDLDTTLVAGAALPGHDFYSEELHNNRTVKATGTTVPWNTLAVWNTALLARVGFVAIGNGSTVLDAAAGIEEVSTVSVIQDLARSSVDEVPLCKLIRMPNTFNMKWNTNFKEMDPARYEMHRKKMNMKNVRARDHLSTLRTAPATITHVVHTP